MVPHIRIEEEINRILNAQDEMQAMVTAIPDEKKGERLIVLHKPLSKSVEEIRQGLIQAGFPNIFVPAPGSFFEVEDLPVLGSGKLDLKRLKQMALERTDCLTNQRWTAKCIRAIRPRSPGGLRRPYRFPTSPFTRPIGPPGSSVRDYLRLAVRVRGPCPSASSTPRGGPKTSFRTAARSLTVAARVENCSRTASSTLFSREAIRWIPG
jgi:hypothetical protein